MSVHQPIIQNITKNVQNHIMSTSIARSVVFGGGLAYAWSNEFWHHTPLIWLSPYAYASYQVFVSQKDVIKWYRETRQSL
jgi:hypothetical protein